MVSNQPVPGAVMTVYQGTSFTPELTATGYALFRAGIKVSAGTCDDLAESLRRRHQLNGTRWRLLGPMAQAGLAAGFGTSPATCWRDVAEGISVLADRGRRISLRDVARLAVRMGWDYLIVDGTHVPVVTFGRKTGGQRAFYSGKHKRHGLNVQTVCSPAGELLWAAAPQPGATVDVTAARKAGIAEILTSVIGVLADLGYPGWDETVITGRRQARGKDLTPAQRAANRLQAQLRCVGERGSARLKYRSRFVTSLGCRSVIPVPPAGVASRPVRGEGPRGPRRFWSSDAAPTPKSSVRMLTRTTITPSTADRAEAACECVGFRRSGDGRRRSGGRCRGRALCGRLRRCGRQPGRYRGERRGSRPAVRIAACRRAAGSPRVQRHRTQARQPRRSRAAGW